MRKQPNTVDSVSAYFRDIFRDTYCKPLGIVTLAHTEQSLEGVVSRNHKSSKVGQELTTNVEEDEEEVGCDKTEESVDLWNGCLLLEVCQGWVFG